MSTPGGVISRRPSRYKNMLKSEAPSAFRQALDPSPARPPSVGTTFSILLAISALTLAAGIGAWVGVFYSQENIRWGDTKDALAFLQEQFDNATFSDGNFTIFHELDPTREFCFNAGNISTDTKRNLTVQNADGIIAYLADIPVITGVFLDTVFTVQNAVDPSKELMFNLSMITANTTRIYEWPNQDGVVALLSDVVLLLNNATEFLDSSFAILNDPDMSKRATFDASGIMTSTTKVYAFPNLNGTLVLTSGSQTLTDKILVGPSNTIEASAVQTTGAAVVFAGAAPPIAGQLPTATGPGAISWQTGATAVQTTGPGAVDFSGAAPPSVGQVATATGPGAITWQTPSDIAAGVETTGSPVDFSTASPPTIGQIPVFDGISAINWENVTAAGAAEFLATSGVNDVNVGLSAPPGGSGYYLRSSSTTAAVWTVFPSIPPTPPTLQWGVWGVAGLTNIAGYQGFGTSGLGKFMRVGNTVTAMIQFTATLGPGPPNQLRYFAFTLALAPVSGNFGFDDVAGTGGWERTPQGGNTGGETDTVFVVRALTGTQSIVVATRYIATHQIGLQGKVYIHFTYEV